MVSTTLLSSWEVCCHAEDLITVLFIMLDLLEAPIMPAQPAFTYNNATLKWPFLLPLVPHPHHMVALFQDMDFGHLLSVKELPPLCKPSRVHLFRPSDELHILKIPINPQFIFNNFWWLSWISERIKLGILLRSEDEGKSQTSSQDLRMFDKTGMIHFLDMSELMSCWSVYMSFLCWSVMGLQHDKLL